MEGPLWGSFVLYSTVDEWISQLFTAFYINFLIWSLLVAQRILHCACVPCRVGNSQLSKLTLLPIYTLRQTLCFPCWFFFLLLVYLLVLLLKFVCHCHNIHPLLSEGHMAYFSSPYKCIFLIGSSCVGEGNGNPLQYSCLENPYRGAW